MPVPKRGEIWWVDLGLVAKVRPCLVLSVPAADEDRALATDVTHTTSPRQSRFEVPSRTRWLKPGVFDAQNLVMVPLPKLARKIEDLPPDQISLVETAVKHWLGLL